MSFARHSLSLACTNEKAIDNICYDLAYLVRSQIDDLLFLNTYFYNLQPYAFSDKPFLPEVAVPI